MIRHDSGQVLPITVLFLPVLIGAAALSLSVGAAYFAQSRLQNAVDAGALAGAQAVQQGGTASKQSALVLQDDSAATGITITTSGTTVQCSAQAQVPGGFASLLGIQNFTVRATADASTAGTEAVLMP